MKDSSWWRPGVDLLLRLRRGPQSTLGRTLLLVAAVALFVVVSIVSYRSLPAERPPVSWSLLVVLLVLGSPMMLLANALEFRTISRLCETEASWSEAVSVSIAATVANLLPVPGAAIVRSARLKQAGVSTSRIAIELASIGLAFLAVAAGFLTAAAGLSGLWRQSAVFLGCFVVTSGGSLVLQVKRSSVGWRGRLALILGTEAVVLLVVAARLWLVLLAIQGSSDIHGAIALAAGSALSTSVAFVPAGLGAKEILSGLLGSTAGVDVAIGAFAAAVDRLAFLVGLGVITLLGGSLGKLPGLSLRSQTTGSA